MTPMTSRIRPSTGRSKSTWRAAAGGRMKAVPKSMKGKAVCRTCNKQWKMAMKDQYASSDDEDGLRINQSCLRLYSIWEDMAMGSSDCDDSEYEYD